MRIATMVAGLALAATAWGTSNNTVGAMGANPGSFQFKCPRAAVSLYNLLNELNYAYHCNPQVFCNGHPPKGFLHKQISQDPGANINQWIESKFYSASMPTYSVGQQDALLAKAKSIANANTPQVTISTGVYGLYDIQFFQHVIYGANYTHYLIGANVTYVLCPVNMIG
jgi:hypothetical protein